MRQHTAILWIQEQLSEIWLHVRNAYVRKARKQSEELVQDLQNIMEESKDENRGSLRDLAHACHAAGYTTSMSVRSHDVSLAIYYYESMLNISRKLRDDVLLVISLTYKGDSYRRKGYVEDAMECLLEAYGHRPQKDAAALGNCAQLLGRVYSLVGNEERFEKLMAEAENIARDIDAEENSLHGQYSLGTVYIDYAHHYSKVGEIKKAFDYLQRAEETLPESIHWSTLLTARRGMLLVKNGDLATGVPLVVKAIELGHEHGNERMFDHFHALDRYLSRRIVEFTQAGVLVKDALDGPRVYR